MCEYGALIVAFERDLNVAHKLQIEQSIERGEEAVNFLTLNTEKLTYLALSRDRSHVP
jgi:hypothetical protein